MRARITTLLLSLLVFVSASRAGAAAVDITLSLETGTTRWDLVLGSSLSKQVGGLFLVPSESLGSFTQLVGASNPCVCLPGDPVPLSLSFSPPLFVSTGPGVLVGYFSSSVNQASLVQLLPGDDLAGGTVFDAFGAPILDYAIHIVPEPVAAALLALAALALARRLNGI